MAPKGQAKAKGKAARCKAAYTAEEARAQSSTAKRSRRGCGIAPSDAWLHESVQESLRANYGGMSDQEVGGTLVEGVTLVERLRRDKRAWCMEGVPALSQAYHNNNRRLYRTVRRKVDDLAVTGAKGNEQPVRDAVLEGLAMLKLRRPCRSALAALLAKKGLAFTQKELVYVCRAVAAQNPEASDGSLALVLACVGCFAREGLTASQPEEFACMREVLDRGLVVAMKAECTAPADTTALALLQDYKAQLGLFMNVDTAGRVLRASGDALVDLASSLTGICETSESGQFLLGWKVASVTVARVELLIKNKVEELLQGQISEATIETKREELAAELEGWYVEKGCWHPVSVRYRGVAVRMQVQTAMEHFDQCVSAAWQQLALSRGLLDCVGPEAQLGHLPASEGCGDVDPALLLSARRARQMAVEELAGAEDAATIAKVLKKAAAKLARKDLGSKVWSKFYFGLCDAASAEACLEARILETMPNKDRQLSLPQVLEQMNCLAKSGLARFVPKPCLRSIRLVLGLLGDLSMGSGCSPKSPTEFMAMAMHMGDMFYVGLGIIVWAVHWPGDEARVWGIAWVSKVVLRNLIINALIYELWHQLLFGGLSTDAVKACRFNSKSPYDDGGQNLRRERFFTTCGFIMSSAYECLIAHLWASGAIAQCGHTEAGSIKHVYPGCRLPDPLELPVTWWPYFLLAFPFMTQLRCVHFFFVHRMMHPWWNLKNGLWQGDIGACLYRHVHSLHHKSYNMGPWSSLSMHPIEHLLYFSGALVALVVPLHPLHLLLMKYHTDISALPGHDGHGEPGGNDICHYLHHTHFECNYGFSFPNYLDKLFGTYENGAKFTKAT